METEFDVNKIASNFFESQIKEGPAHKFHLKSGTVIVAVPASV